MIKNCDICKSSHKKVGRPKDNKKKSPGRPSQYGTSKLWTVTDSAWLCGTIPENPLPRTEDDIVELVKCPVCEEMLWKPVLNVDCHQVICLDCILSRTEGVMKSCIKCPVLEVTPIYLISQHLSFPKQQLLILLKN